MAPEVTLSTHAVRKPNGIRYAYYQLRWFGTDGKRYSQNVGRTNELSRRTAEKLRQAKELELRQKPGLCSPGRVPTLKTFLDAYIESRRSELAQGTVELHQQTARYLTGFMGEHRRLDQITRFDAREFKTALAKGELSRVNKRKHQTMSPRTIDQHVRNARTIFNRAVDDDLLLYNPFDRLSGGLAPVAKDWHYVNLEEFQKLLDACPCQGWRTFLGLCRLAGLRQGEALALRWDQAELQGGRLKVWAQKTKRYRIVPVAPELLPILEKARELAAEHAEFVVTDVLHVNVWRDFGVIRKRAGIEPYEKWCHTLRKNRESDWIAAGFPFHVVVEWMGHSDEVARQHYLRVNESDLAAATQSQIPEKLTQLLTQLDDSEAVLPDGYESQVFSFEEFKKKAGDRIRTDDVQLGKPGATLKNKAFLSPSGILLEILRGLRRFQGLIDRLSRHAELVRDLGNRRSGLQQFRELGWVDGSIAVRTSLFNVERMAARRASGFGGGAFHGTPAFVGSAISTSTRFTSPISQALQ